jgi:hypothetical protein
MAWEKIVSVGWYQGWEIRHGRGPRCALFAWGVSFGPEWMRRFRFQRGWFVEISVDRVGKRIAFKLSQRRSEGAFKLTLHGGNSRSALLRVKCSRIAKGFGKFVGRSFVGTRARGGRVVVVTLR